MAIEVKVLYATPTADPKVWTQPFTVQTAISEAEINALPGSDVLAVSVFAIGPPGPARLLVSRLYPRIGKLYLVGDPDDVLYGTDFYAVCCYAAAPSNWLFWDQWDERDDKFYAIDMNDLQAGRQTFARSNLRGFPPGATVKVFNPGAYVHPLDWDVARTIIDSDLRI